jgi:hypothetical protein
LRFILYNVECVMLSVIMLNVVIMSAILPSAILTECRGAKEKELINEIKDPGFELNDTKHNGLLCDTQHNNAPHLVPLC